MKRDALPLQRRKPQGAVKRTNEMSTEELARFYRDRQSAAYVLSRLGKKERR